MESVILDKEFKMVSVIDVYESFIWTDRYNENGDFEIYASANAEYLNLFKKDYYIFNPLSDRLMIIESRKIEEDNGSFKITITGRSLESILSRRVVKENTTYSGSVQDTIKKILTESIINPSDSDRKINNFIFKTSSDKAITSLTLEETQYRGEDLYTIVSDLCKKNKIGFKVILNDENKFVFSLYNSTDHSYDQDKNNFVIFSPDFNNLSNSEYEDNDTDLKNVLYVAGDDADNPTVVSVGKGSGLSRREHYYSSSISKTTKKNGSEVKLSQSQYETALKDKGNSLLKTDYKGKHDITGDVESIYGSQFVYGRDFTVGDKVEIQDSFGNYGSTYISEIIMCQDQNGLRVYPTFDKFEDNHDD